jgi:hypothetical protein
MASGRLIRAGLTFCLTGLPRGKKIISKTPQKLYLHAHLAVIFAIFPIADTDYPNSFST